MSNEYWEKLKIDAERELIYLEKNFPTCELAIKLLKSRITLAEVHLNQDVDPDKPLFDIKFKGIASGDCESSCWDVPLKYVPENLLPRKSYFYEDLYRLYGYELPKEVMDFYGDKMVDVEMECYLTKEHGKNLVVFTAFISECKSASRNIEKPEK